MPKPQSGFGVVSFSYMMAWQPDDTLQFLEHCHTLGAAGIQCPISGDTGHIRARAEQFEMYIEGIVPMPIRGDTSEFEEALKRAQRVNAVSLRAACLGSRRYETFHSLDDWKQHVAASMLSIEAALPVLDRYRIPLGLENHKDWTTGELEQLMRKYATAYFGACIDFGNNIALLDDPVLFVERLAPYAVSTHIKDIGVARCPEGFLLSEVPLGQGCLDLEHCMSAIREKRPETRFSVEMITRDPLTIPCLRNPYWTTLPERRGLDLAQTLRFVEENALVSPLPRVSHLSREAQRDLENQNVMACLEYARHNLGVLI